MDRNSTLDILQRAVQVLEPKSASEKVYSRYINEQDKAIEELKQRLAVAERDAADKANALKLAQRVKEMLSDHVKRQREMIKMLESQIPSQSRSPAPMVMPALGKSVSDSTADSMRPRRRRTCDPTSVLEHRRTRHSRSMRSSVVQV